MKRSARVAFGGAVHHAFEHADGVQLVDGRVLAEDQVVWLPPFEVGTVIALGINYAAHARELAQELTLGSSKPKNRSYPGAARVGGGVGRANWPTILRQM